MIVQWVVGFFEKENKYSIIQCKIRTWDHHVDKIFNPSCKTKQSSNEEIRVNIFKSSAKNRIWHFLRTSDSPFINKLNSMADKSLLGEYQMGQGPYLNRSHVLG